MYAVLLNVLLRQTKIYEIEAMCLTSHTHQKVIGLDISMQELLTMYKLDSLKHLDGDHESTLEIHFPSAKVEDILEGGPKQIHDEYVHVTFGATEMGTRNSSVTFVFAVEIVY